MTDAPRSDATGPAATGPAGERSAGGFPVDPAAPAPDPDPAGDVRPPEDLGGTAPSGDAGVAARAGAAEPADDGGTAPADLSVEALLDDVERLTGERDTYLDTLRRTQADFENYRKRMMRQQVEEAERLTGRLVEDLLPVLDACDAALGHGASEVEPVFAALLQTLEKNGLERLDEQGEAFDPNRHEAVMHEPADGDAGGPVVADVMRRGYAWKGRILRPAMVKVRG